MADSKTIDHRPVADAADIAGRRDANDQATATAASAEADRAAPDIDAMAAELLSHATQQAAATARWLELVAAFDRAQGHVRWGCASCAHWLSWKCGLDLRAAREQVRVARQLADLPALRGALERGVLSYSKVRALTRIATPGNEHRLLALAEHRTAAQLERIVTAWRRGDDAEDDQAAVRHARRTCSAWWAEDGMLVLSARLAPEAGAIVLKALEHAENNLPRDEAGTAPTRRADAIAEVATAYLDGAHSAATHERHQVILHIDATTPENAIQPNPADGSATARSAQFDHGPALAIETANRLACDATIVTVSHRGESALIQGRSRTIPPALRRLLRLRDGGCRFPGCTHVRVHQHHLRHWTDGGPSVAANLISLCSLHHRQLHEGGWRIEGDPSGPVVFISPDERRIAEDPARVLPAGSAEQLLAQLDRTAA